MRHDLIAVLLAGAVLPAQGPAGRLDGMAEIGAAAAAKRVASAVFLGGRQVDSVLAEEFAPETPLDRALGPLIELELDRDAELVRATVLGVTRSAVYRAGLGCTLAIGRSVADLRAQVVPTEPAAVIADDLPWPSGDRTSAERPPGIDEELLRTVVAGAFEEPASGPRVRTRAVVVVYRGVIVAERYGAGFDHRSLLEGWSMTKSVTHALVGARVGEGAMALDAPLGLAAWSGDDDPRAAITLQQALWMSSGLQWDERYDDVTADPARMLFGVADIAAFGAARELVHPPGSHWHYSSATTNLICRALRETFELEADYWAYPRRALFDRIGMRSAVVEVGPAGTFVGSSLMWATARDWARFGLLYLRDGVWQGERILPEGWVDNARLAAPAGPPGRYGSHWWLNAGDPQRPGTRAHRNLPADLYYAGGFEGQTVAVFPSDDLVVVRLGCTKDDRAWRVHPFLAALRVVLGR